MKCFLYSLAIGFLAIASTSRADGVFAQRAFSGDIRFFIEGEQFQSLGKVKRPVLSLGRVKPVLSLGKVKTPAQALGEAKTPALALGKVKTPALALGKVKAPAVLDSPTTMPVPKAPPKVPTLFSINVKQPLDQISARLCSILQAELNKEPNFYKGFRPYGVSIVRSATPEMNALIVGNSIQLEYILRGNTLTSSFRTPDVALGIGLGEYADPKIQMTLDLTFKATVTPQLNGAPTVTNVSVTPSNAKLYPANLSGAVLKAINNFVSFVGGPNFVRKAEGMINAQSKSSADPLKGMFNRLERRIAPLTREAKSLHVQQDANRISVIYSTKVYQGPIVR